MSCLLFADDLVLLAEDDFDMDEMIGALEEWSLTWEMRVTKCGVMEVGKNRQSDDSEFVFLLNGVPLPIVNEYTYLGCKVTWDLDLYEMASARAAIGVKTLNSVRPFLANKSIPIPIKTTFIRAVLIPQCLYEQAFLSYTPGQRYIFKF